MGGNSSSVGRTRVTTPTTPKVDASQEKLDKLVDALKALSKDERSDALSALRDAGLDSLATALQGIIGRGSRPPERPDDNHEPSN